MENVIALEAGPALAPVWEQWERSGLACEAFEGLPVAVALAEQRNGAPEPQLLHGNRAFASLTGRRLSAAACRLDELAGTARDPQDEQRLREGFAAGEAVSEALAIRGSDGAITEMNCQWTPLRALPDGGRAWSVTLTRTDLTQRKAAERAVLRSEREAARSRALLSEAIESMTDGFVWFDSDGRLVLCNQKCRDLYPRLAAELKPGASYTELLKLGFDREHDGVPAGEESALRAWPWPGPFLKLATFRTKTSEGRWIQAHNNPLESGGFIGIRFDVTDQVAAEEALRESEQRFRDFAQSGPGGFWEMDESLRFSSFLEVQKESVRSRPTAGEATGRTFWELFADHAAPDDFWTALRHDLEAHRPIKDLRVTYASPGASPGGGRFHWRINGMPHHDRSGRFRGYRGVAEDESAEVEARRRAEAAEARLTEAVESISGGFALFDKNDRLVLCNHMYRSRTFGHGLHVVSGVSFENLARANAYGGCIAGLRSDAEREDWIGRRVAAHRAARGSYEIPWHDGRTFLMTERRTHDGGIASVSTDITELRLARENAERANWAKTRFLAAASHDLRQPLHAMELFVAALEATPGSEEVRSIAGDLREACDAAGRLLNALLDVSGMESGKLEARMADFPVQRLLDRMLRVYGPQARERGLALRLVPCGRIVRSDPHLLERILGNLLSNAVRYTPQGRILVGCRRRGDKLRIEIWDTGPGIAEVERERIFEEFHQIDNVARERYRGVGLGLSIVRRLADILGHEVLLQSVRGQGSVFAVELALSGQPSALPGPQPAGFAPASLAPTGLAQVAMPRRTMVLVIDDDRQIRKGMVRALESWGCVVQTAGDYDAAAAGAAARPIDLIIADYRLPRGCNGVQAARRLRAVCGACVPVLIVTADQGQQELREIAGEGFPTLQKPVNPDALRLAMADLIEDFAVSAPEEGLACPRP